MKRILPFVLLFGCAEPTPETETAAAPSLGKADSSDAADRACQIILRQVDGPPRLGYEADCSSGLCFLVWRAVVDVAVDAVGTPELLYHESWDPDWYAASATYLGDGEPGYDRYEIRFSEHTIVAGSATTPLDVSDIELVPYLRTGGGGRLFDHNRNPGDLDNYRVNAGNGHSINQKPSFCRAPGHAVAWFRERWEHDLYGPIVAGQTLTVDYDLDRMTGCFGSTYNGYSTWNTEAYAWFLPGGQLVHASVKGYADHFGQIWYDQPVDFAVPADATEVQMWFHHSGRTCEAMWDSAYGANYRFAVAAGL